jgi:hypothetical protein
MKVKTTNATLYYDITATPKLALAVEAGVEGSAPSALPTAVWTSKVVDTRPSL